MSWAKEGRSYPTAHGPVWSSTTILGMKDKSAPLMHWAVREGINYIEREVAKRSSRVNGFVTIQDVTLQRIFDKGRKAFRDITEEASDIGIRVHRLIEAWAKYGVKQAPKGDDKRIVNAFGLFLEWAKKVELEPIAVEKKVWSLRHEYGGTLDLVARGKFNSRWKKKRVYTIDTKTSKGIYETFGPQVASYTEAYRERAGGDGFPKVKIDGEGIIRVGKTDGVPEFVDCTSDHEINFRRFLALKEAYILWNGRPK